MLPIGRVFGRITQKGPTKKWERPDKSAAEFWPILNRKGRIGPNFRKFCFLPLILSNSTKVQVISSFIHLQGQKVFFLSPKCPQKGKVLGRLNFFPQWPNFSRRTGRKVLSRVGNTELVGKLESIDI